MNDNQIYKLALTFRTAIEQARDLGEFQEDITFKNFPCGCCGDSSYLLAEYLYSHGVETIWTSMDRHGSHAWLVLKDLKVKEPTPTSFTWPEELWDTLESYGMEKPEKPIDTTHFQEEDLAEGVIIDITADQFPDYDIPVYVGPIDSFHKQFSFIQAHNYNGMCNARLEDLYRKIKKYI